MRAQVTSRRRQLSLAIIVAAALATPFSYAASVPAPPPVVAELSYEQALAALVAETAAVRAAMTAEYEASRAALSSAADAATAARQQQHQQELATLATTTAAAQAAAELKFQNAMEDAGKGAAAASMVIRQWQAAALKSVEQNYSQQLAGLDSSHTRRTGAIDAQADGMVTALQMSLQAALSKNKNSSAARQLEQDVTAAIASINTTRAADLAVAQQDYASQKAVHVNERATARAELDAAYRNKTATVNMELAQTSARLSSSFAADKAALQQEHAQTLSTLESGYLADRASAGQALQQELAALEAQLAAQEAALELQHTDALAQLEASREEADQPTRLAWTIPEQRVNGAPLHMSELSGYELYYSSVETELSGVIVISAPDQTRYEVRELQPGVYVFAVSAVDAAGLKSDLSPLVETTID